MLEILNWRWILASASPRRRQLLELAGIRPEVWTGAPDESLPPGTPASEWALRAARKKAEWFYSRRPSGAWLLTADTTVILNNKVINKPTHPQEAFEMLKMLCGKTHLVTTGVCILYDQGELTFAETTEVEFSPMPDDFLWDYAQSGQGLDKAGAYGAQDRFGLVAIRRIHGCFYNVMGLPVNRILWEIRQLTENTKSKRV
ncbi:MAG: Maf family protein [Flavobacteriales bacterium]|nr:Maf family protein [Flavobacteriales bacterium]MCX7769106.1 Maf family protein [Flavobacteriales bacterium]MDW8409850.1 Maf family protein [Flavobacteriales bacterium]